MMSRWIEEVFPKARAAAFVHRNTEHLHIHVWIAARQIDDKKINLSARAFRQMDEQWNRIYSAIMNRDEQEHLSKKWETERYKQLKREGKSEGIERPERVGHHWNPSFFNERERARLGVGLAYDRDEKGVRGNQSMLTGKTSSGPERERIAPSREHSFEASTQEIEQALGAARQAVSEVKRIHQDAQRLACREPEQKCQLDIERER